MLDVPLPLFRGEVSLVWHGRFARDPRHRWIREIQTVLPALLKKHMESPESPEAPCIVRGDACSIRTICQDHSCVLKRISNNGVIEA